MIHHGETEVPKISGWLRTTPID
jgi:hypothetical protein